MRVLSLFDGISCARASLERANLPISTYYASEIDKNAIKVSSKNYPDIIQLGSVVGLTPPENIDLLIGGSPCTDLSIAKKDRKGLEGDHSSLFWEYVRIKKECNPKWFVLENVASMPKKDKDIITAEMGVEPVMFNASLVSAQCRKRLFWTNILFTLPEDKGILLKDILQPDAEVDERMVVDGKSYCLTATYSHANSTETGVRNSVERKQRTQVKQVKLGHLGNSDAQANRIYSPEGKGVTLSANGGGLGAKTGLYSVEQRIRKLTPIECERLQGLPDDYTSGIAMTQRYKCLGNAFNVDVVAHILRNLAEVVVVLGVSV
jgi:DNA (cytosine-5)-methyltransferase 3A